MRRIRGILFDLGETLLDFGRLDMVALFLQGARLSYAYLLELGQPVPPFQRFFRRQLWAIRWRYVLSRMTHWEFSSLDVLEQISLSMGQTLTGEQLQELAWRWYRPLSECARLERGLVEMLGGLREGGISLGLVSNTFVPSDALDRHLESVGLLEHLPVRVYSSDVGFRKPARRIFQIAADRLGVGAEESMFVGDSLRADVAGARRAGMVAVLKDPTGRRLTWGMRPDHTIATMSELPAIVDGYNGGADL